MQRMTNKLLSIKLLIVFSFLFLVPFVKANAVTVWFDTNGGDYVEEQYLEEGDKVTRPEDPYRDGYQFAGWYQDDTFNISFLFDEYTVENYNITIFAKWEEIISSGRAEITLPVAGETLNRDWSTDDDTFTITNVSYYLGDTYLDDNYVFLPATSYEIFVTVLPNDGYVIDTEHAMFTFNYHESEFYGYSGNAAVYRFIHEVPEAGVIRIQSDIGSAFYPNMIAGFSGQDSDEVLHTARITNTGSVPVTVVDHAPTANGPFGTYWYDSSIVLNPNDYIDIRLRLFESSAYANTPGYYEGEYEIIATSVDNEEDTFTIYIPTNVTLFEYKENTITFNSNGGSEIQSGHAYTGELLNRPENPINGNNALVDWCKDEELTMPFDFENEQVWDDMTLYAKWVPGATISFVTDGDPIDPIVVPIGLPFIDLAMFLNPTYSENPLMYLSGIKLNSLENAPLTDEDIFSLSVEEDTVVYLIWSEKEIINQIVLNLNNHVDGWEVGSFYNEETERMEPLGNVPSLYPIWGENRYGSDYQEFITNDDELLIGTLVADNEYYARTTVFLCGDEFVFADDILSHIVVENATFISAEFLEDGRISVKVKFTALDNNYEPEHNDEITIDFNSNGGTEYEPVTFPWEDGTILPTPERNGYIFGGWANLGEHNEILEWYEGGEEVHYNYNVTLSAIWYLEENEVISLNIGARNPINGDTIGQVERSDEWGSWVEPDRFPDVWGDEENAHYHIQSARYVEGLCPDEESFACVEDFYGTFETDNYYYINIEIRTDDGYFITENVLDNILVNGVAPEEVYGVYGMTDTVFVAKVKAVKEIYLVRFMDGEAELFNRNVRYDETVEEPNPAPQNGNYYVVGWYLDETLNNPYDFTTRVTTDFDLFAKWELNQNAVGNIRVGGNPTSISECNNCNSVTITYSFGTMTITGNLSNIETDNNQYLIYGLGDITVNVTGENVIIRNNGENVGASYNGTLTAGNELRIDAEVDVPNVPIVDDYDDIRFNITWNKSFVNVRINSKDVIEESQEFGLETYSYDNILVENAGYVGSDKTNTFRFITRFGDYEVTEFTINDVLYTEENENVEVTDEGWFITVPGATVYTISGTGNEEITPPRTILWANVDANTEAEEYDEDMLVEHGSVKIVGVYSEGEKVAGSTEADNDGMGYAVVEPGDDVIFEFTPEYGYQLTGILVNGMEVSSEAAMNQYKFVMPDANVHFQAVFKKTEDIVKSNTDKVKSGEITLGNTLEGGSAKLTITDVELSSDKIKGFENAAGDNTISSYLDIDLYNIFYKGKDDENDVWSTKISELENEATITIKLADDVDVTKVVLVHNIHDGEQYEIIEIESYDEVNHTITFKTKSFSNYAIALKNTENSTTDTSTNPTPNQTDTTETPGTTTTTDNSSTNTNTNNPKTGDSILTYVLIMLGSGITLLCLIAYYRKNKKNEA